MVCNQGGSFNFAWYLVTTQWHNTRMGDIAVISISCGWHGGFIYSWPEDVQSEIFLTGNILKTIEAKGSEMMNSTTVSLKCHLHNPYKRYFVDAFCVNQLMVYFRNNKSGITLYGQALLAFTCSPVDGYQFLIAKNSNVLLMTEWSHYLVLSYSYLLTAGYGYIHVCYCF